MKRTFCIYCFLLMFAFELTSQCFATQPTDNYYVQPNEVYIDSNGIYASIDGIVIEIQSLHTDERGVFVPVEDIIAGELEWCPFCGRWYDPDQGHSDCSGFPE
jgi:hypothetical protein